MRIEAATHIEAPVHRVWTVLTDWETQARWMVDVRSLEVVSDRRDGLGVVLRVRTDIVPGLVVRDELHVIEWVPQVRIGVRHQGRFYAAVGAWELAPTSDGTHLTWWDEVAVPLGGPGDTLASLLIAPVARRVFRRSIANLKRLCEGESVRPQGTSSAPAKSSAR